MELQIITLLGSNYNEFWKRILKNFWLLFLAGIALTACATQGKKGAQLAGDVYTGSETVEYLATGVKR